MRLLTTVALLLGCYSYSNAQEYFYTSFVKEVQSFMYPTGKNHQKNKYNVYLVNFYNNPGLFCFFISRIVNNYEKKHLSCKYYLRVGNEIIMANNLSPNKRFNTFILNADSSTRRYIQSKLLPKGATVTDEPEGTSVCIKNGEIRRKRYSGDMPKNVSLEDFPQKFSPKPYNMDKLK